MRSLRHPHPETHELAELGFEEWSARFPDEDDLVDAEAGTELCWVPGDGWHYWPHRARATASPSAAKNGSATSSYSY